MRKMVGDILNLIKKMLTLRVVPNQNGVLEKKIKVQDQKSQKKYKNSSTSVLGMRKYY